MSAEPSGIFSPIEKVVEQAERRAEAEHRRLTEPCSHETQMGVWERRERLCMDCGEWVERS